jgi:energy-coupling factor transport system ATP-binding protein
VGQNPEAQLFCDTVMEEVTLGPRSNGQGQDACEREGEALLRRYGLESRRTASLGTLSLGQKQLVATLSMLAIRPKVLLLDEPTSYLDVATADRLFSHLEALCRLAISCPLSSSTTAPAGRFANRLVRIENGRLDTTGRPRPARGMPGRLDWPTCGRNSPPRPPGRTRPGLS